MEMSLAVFQSNNARTFKKRVSANAHGGGSRSATGSLRKSPNILRAAPNLSTTDTVRVAMWSNTLALDHCGKIASASRSRSRSRRVVPVVLDEHIIIIGMQGANEGLESRAAPEIIVLCISYCGRR